MQIGSRYMLSLAPGRHERGPGGGMRIGDDQQIKLRHAFMDSGIRVMLLLACPCTNMPRTLSFLDQPGPEAEERHQTSGSGECPQFPSSFWN